MSGNIVEQTDFTNDREALDYFNRCLDALGYDNTTVDTNSVRTKYEAGGRGHDYRFELEITVFASNPIKTTDGADRIYEIYVSGIKYFQVLDINGEEELTRFESLQAALNFCKNENTTT